jgi:hypothetical protein
VDANPLKLPNKLIYFEYECKFWLSAIEICQILFLFIYQKSSNKQICANLIVNDPVCIYCHILDTISLLILTMRVYWS